MIAKPPCIQIPEINNVKPHAFFSAFFAERENDLVGCGPVQRYQTNAEIFREDDLATLLYLIERGIVMLSRLQPDGSEKIVGIRGRHWLLAAPAVFLCMPYEFTGTTLTPCNLRAISAQCFFHLIKTNEIFSWELHRLFSQEILNTLRKVEVTSMSADERLRHFLRLLISEISPEELEIHNHFDIPLKHRELAEIVGVTSEHLCRLVKKMEQDGILGNKRGMLTIINASKLTSLQ